MVQESDSDKDFQLARVLDTLAPRLETPKAELVAEIEMRLTEMLGVEVGEVFRAVAASQRHDARSMNLDRVHKSALVILAHVLAGIVNRADGE